MAVHKFLNRQLYLTNSWRDVLDGLRGTSKVAIDPYIEWAEILISSGKNGPSIIRFSLFGYSITWRKDVVDRIKR